MKDKKILSGVYAIENLTTGKRYVGSSKNIRVRMRKHKSDLKHRRHHNNYLQNAANRYGLNDFKGYVVELCNIEDRYIRERYWIEHYKSNNLDFGYNLALVDENGSHEWTKERRKKHSKAMMERDMDKKYIVFNKSNLHETKILTRKQLLKSITQDTLNKLVWTTNTYDNNYIYPQDTYSGCRLLERITKDLYDPTSQANIVYVFNQENDIIKTFPSQAATANYYNVSEKAIRKNLTNQTRLLRKYYLSNNPDFIIPVKLKRKRVGGRKKRSISIDGIHYSNIEQASKTLNLPVNTIYYRVYSPNFDYQLSA